jgi:hypothetical protein
MKEAKTAEGLTLLTGELILSQIPGFYVRHTEFGNIATASQDDSSQGVRDLVREVLQQALGVQFSPVLGEVTLAPENQSERGIHSDSEASETRRSFRMHRTIEGSCDVLFSREVIPTIGSVMSSPERDDAPINSLLDEGYAATEFFEAQIHRATGIRDGDLVIFTSVGQRPTWHKFITVDSPRFSKVTFLNTSVRAA